MSVCMYVRVFVTRKNISQYICAVAATKQKRLQLLSEAVNTVSVTQWIWFSPRHGGTIMRHDPDTAWHRSF